MEENKSELCSGNPRPKEYWALLRRPCGDEYGKDEKLKSYSEQKYAYFKCDNKTATVAYFDYFIGDEPKNIRIIDDIGEQRCEVRYIVFMVLVHICSGVLMDDLRKTPLCENFPFDVIVSSETEIISEHDRIIQEKIETVFTKQSDSL